MDENSLKLSVDGSLSPAPVAPKASPLPEGDKSFLNLLFTSKSPSRSKLLASSRDFRAILKNSKDDFSANYGLALNLFELYKVSDEHHFLLESLKFFEKALTIKNDPGIYPDIAEAFAAEAEISLEPSDYLKAIEFYSKSKTNSSKAAEKISDLFFDLYPITKERAHLEQSAFFAEKATELSPSKGKGWFLLGRALTGIYIEFFDEDLAFSADQAFTLACQNGFDKNELNLTWARLLLHWSKNSFSTDKLVIALERLSRCKGDAFFEAKLLEISITSLLGTQSDRHTLLQKAKEEACRLLEDFPDEPELHITLGSATLALAAYFEDLDLYYMAAEHFQEALSIDSSLADGWKLLAESFVQCANLEEEPLTSLMRASKFYIKAIEIEPKASHLLDYAVVLRLLGELQKEPKILERAILHFEQGLATQKHALHLFQKQIFELVLALESMGVETGEEFYFARALESLQRLALFSPQSVEIYMRTALIHAHLGDLQQDVELYRQADHFFRIASRMAPDNDALLIDWSITLMNIAENSSDSEEQARALVFSEHRAMQAARLGNPHAYFQLACLFAHTHRKTRALEMLAKAESAEALPPVSEILAESWLGSLHDEPLFQKLTRE